MFIEIDDIKLHYQAVGEGRPVLFLHGLFGISDGMMEMFEPMFSGKEGWRRYYLDSPGNGKSAAPDWMTSSDQVLDTVEAFIYEVMPAGNFCVVGYSFGGYLSMGLLYRMNERIDGIVLLCPLVEPDESLRHIPKSELRKVDVEYFKSLDPQAQAEMKRSGVVVLDPSELDRWAKVYSPAFEVANAEFLNRLKAEGYSFSFDIFSLEKDGYERPTMILTGRQDSSVGYLDAWRLEPLFKRATYVVLDAAGHGLPLDQGDVFTSLFKEWLERVESFEDDMKVNR